MKQLANLLETLIFNYSTNKKIEIIEQHLHKVAKADRGYTIAFLLLYETQINKSISPPLALWMVAIPIFDVCAVMMYRFKNHVLYLTQTEVICIIFYKD